MPETAESALVIGPLSRKTRAGQRRKVIDQNEIFDSQTEHRHWCELKIRERLKEIRDIEIHKRYEIVVAGVHICDFIPDFQYVRMDGAVVVEDVKSKLTRKLPEYRLKKKLFEAIYKLKVHEFVIDRRRRRRPRPKPPVFTLKPT